MLFTLLHRQVVDFLDWPVGQKKFETRHSPHTFAPSLPKLMSKSRVLFGLSKSHSIPCCCLTLSVVFHRILCAVNGCPFLRFLS